MQRWISRSRRIDLKEMQIEDQFVKKKNIIQRKIEYEQEISKIFVFWFDLIWLGTTFIKPAVGARPKVTFVKFRLQWWWKWWEEKGQYGDVDLFVDCKEGDSIEWVLPLAVTYIGQEDAERSLCFLTLFEAWRMKMTPRLEKYERFEDITYIERENAESIVLFNVARGTKLVKCALCHPGKHKMKLGTTYDCCKLYGTEHLTSRIY